jgi:hypothetical protein
MGLVCQRPQQTGVVVVGSTRYKSSKALQVLLQKPRDFLLLLRHVSILIKNINLLKKKKNNFFFKKKKKKKKAGQGATPEVAGGGARPPPLARGGPTTPWPAFFVF